MICGFVQILFTTEKYKNERNWNWKFEKLYIVIVILTPVHFLTRFQ
jgi:hypothetical protein